MSNFFLTWKVIAENISEKETKGLIQMFNNMDTDGSGTITFEELKSGLFRLGSLVNESEMKQLMDAVSSVSRKSENKYPFLSLLSKIKLNYGTYFSFFTCIFRLILTRVGLLTTLNSLLPLWIGIKWRRKRVCSRLFNTLTRITMDYSSVP